jgi:hypothetical protein
MKFCSLYLLLVFMEVDRATAIPAHIADPSDSPGIHSRSRCKAQHAQVTC